MTTAPLFLPKKAESHARHSFSHPCDVVFRALRHWYRDPRLLQVSGVESILPLDSDGRLLELVLRDSSGVRYRYESLEEKPPYFLSFRGFTSRRRLRAHEVKGRSAMGSTFVARREFRLHQLASGGCGVDLQVSLEGGKTVLYYPAELKEPLVETFRPAALANYLCTVEERLRIPSNPSPDGDLEASLRVLGLGPGAGELEIRGRFRRMIRRCHPDGLSSLPREKRRKMELESSRLISAYKIARAGARA